MNSDFANATASPHKCAVRQQIPIPLFREYKCLTKGGESRGEGGGRKLLTKFVLLSVGDPLCFFRFLH